MKRILLLFLLILGACSDQETVKPTQTPEVVLDNSNASHQWQVIGGQTLVEVTHWGP